MEEEKRQLEI